MEPNTSIKDAQNPFKLLEAYNEDEKDKFIGREEEVKQVYESLIRTKTLTLFGSSGSGKTSLVRCGLAGCFQPTDWLEIYVRREKNINIALVEELYEVYERIPVDDQEPEAGPVDNSPVAVVAKAEAALQAALMKKIVQDIIHSRDPEDEQGLFSRDLTEEEKQYLATCPNPAERRTLLMDLRFGYIVKKLLSGIYNEYFTPIYLIFDQFEELFTLGTEKEQRVFANIIKRVLKISVPCKIVVVLQEEYLAHFTALEKLVPEFKLNKIRIVPMSDPTLEQIIMQSAERSVPSIMLLPDKKTIAAKIIEAVKSEEEEHVQLPYFQVFLYKLWESAKEIAVKENRDYIEFTNELVEKKGKITDVLKNFLEENVRNLNFDDKQLVWKFLKYFTTKSGTKKPLGITDLRSRLIEVDERKLEEWIAHFKDNRILVPLKNPEGRGNKNTELQYELAHQSLAPIIRAIYSLIGEAVGGLPKKAQAIYESLEEPVRKMMRNIMLRLVTLRAGEAVGKRVFKEEFVFGRDEDNVYREVVLGELLESGLIVEGAATDGKRFVKLAHDSLLNSWIISNLGRLYQEKEFTETLYLQGVLAELIKSKGEQESKTTDTLRLSFNGTDEVKWYQDPRIKLLKNHVNSDNSWLNKQETEFVKEGLRKRRIVWTSRVLLYALGTAIVAYTTKRLFEQNESEVR